MRYTLVRIKPTDFGKFEIIFSNGVETEIAIISSLTRNSWCSYSHSGKPINLYSNIKDLINEFESDLNATVDNPTNKILIAKVCRTRKKDVVHSLTHLLDSCTNFYKILIAY